MRGHYSKPLLLRRFRHTPWPLAVKTLLEGSHGETMEEEKAGTYSFLHLDLIDLYSEQLVFEVSIENELISIFHLLSFGTFNQHPCFPTGQRLQRSSQLTVL